MNTVLVFIKKEFLQFTRDPKMFVIILVAPVIQLIFLGYAANMDVNKVYTVVFDKDRSNESKEFIRNFEKSGYFEIIDYVDNYDDLTKAIDKNNALVALIIPTDFSKNKNLNRTIDVQAIFDGSDGNKSSIAQGYMQSIVLNYSTNINLEYINKRGLKIETLPKIVSEVRVWYNPELKTRNFMVPGIVGLLLMIITLLLTSLAIVKEKEIGTLEQLIVSPIKPYQMIIGKLVPFALMGFVSIIVVLTAMMVVFEIPVRGNMVFLFVCSGIFILNLLGLGLFISIFSKTQQQAMMLSIFGLMMPMIFLSGFSFPIENMPLVIKTITYIIPLRYFMTIIRGIILKGIGFAELWKELLILTVMGIGILVLSIKGFRKKLE
ncbi:MAG TPA: ABC transporter permease [Melioribacteraceae bacterium]|nr:ABC transporter permease [Melioribacteraceae bacterium]